MAPGAWRYVTRQSVSAWLHPVESESSDTEESVGRWAPVYGVKSHLQPSRVCYTHACENVCDNMKEFGMC